MHVNRYEFLRPDQLRQAQKECNVAYLPIGPLEWHGPHLPFGVDPLHAAAVAERAASITGGVVFPTLYCGTERARAPLYVKRMGFEDENQYVVGMDVPRNSVPSCYFPEEVFGLILREHIRVIMTIGFDMIVIVNGHGADGQLEVGNRLAREFTNTTDTTVLFCFGFGHPDGKEPFGGHANISETSIIMHLHPETVDVETLPPKDVPLKTSEWGIADSLLFAGKGNAEHTVQFHPRDAYPELGKEYVDSAVEALVATVRSALEERK